MRIIETSQEGYVAIPNHSEKITAMRLLREGKITQERYDKIMDTLEQPEVK